MGSTEREGEGRSWVGVTSGSRGAQRGRESGGGTEQLPLAFGRGDAVPLEKADGPGTVADCAWGSLNPQAAAPGLAAVTRSFQSAGGHTQEGSRTRRACGGRLQGRIRPGSACSTAQGLSRLAALSRCQSRCQNLPAGARGPVTVSEAGMRTLGRDTGHLNKWQRVFGLNPDAGEAEAAAMGAVSKGPGGI